MLESDSLIPRPIGSVEIPSKIACIRISHVFRIPKSQNSELEKFPKKF